MSLKDKIFRGLASVVLLVVMSLAYADLAVAQSPSALSAESDKEYQETNEFLLKTRTIIAKARAETDARAREIEALTNRVGELISNIGSTSEDASNLRSQLLVVNDLLNTERQTSDSLRKEQQALNQELDQQRKNQADTKYLLDRELSEQRRKHKKLSKQLDKLKAEVKTRSNLEQELIEQQRKHAKLSKQVDKLNAELKTTLNSERRLQSNLKNVRTEHSKALKRLNEGVEKITSQAKKNQALTSKLVEARKQIKNLQKELGLLRQAEISARKDISNKNP